MSLTFVRLATALATAAVTVTAAAACRGDSQAASSPQASPHATPAAVVNGTPIATAELALEMTNAARGNNPHQGSAPPVAAPARHAVLEHMIDDELAAQYARREGLEADAELQRELAARQAELDTFKRQRLAALAIRHVRQQARVTDAEVQAFFTAHVDEIRTVTRVWQILVRDRAKIEQAQRELASGAKFEEVAARQFERPLPEGMRPWELGALHWNQIPEQWESVLPTLAVGATSPIIEGPKDRFWIIKVVDRRVDASVTLDTARAAISTKLTGQAADAAQAALLRDLRATAKIETPTGAPIAH